MDRIAIYDISAWQDDITTPQGIDFQKMKAGGARAVIHRATFGMSKDRIFDTCWENGYKAGLTQGAYGFLIEGPSPVEQAQKYIEVVNPHRDINPIADFEKYYDNSAGVWRYPSISALRIYCDVLEKHFGVPPIIYTGKYYWQDYGSKDAWWKRFWLWIAQYQVQEPKLPLPWTEYLIWQHSDKGPAGLPYGKELGVESTQIDSNWFNGDEVKFKATFLGGVAPVVPVVSEVPTSEVTFKLVASTDMNIRSGPGIQYPKVGVMPKGSAVDVRDIGGNDAWVRIAIDKWVCKQINQTVYLV